MGRMDKRVIAAIALVAGILAVIVVVIASSGDDDGGGTSTAISDPTPQGDGNGRGESGSGGSGQAGGEGSQDGTGGSGVAGGSDGTAGQGGQGEGNPGSGGSGDSGGSGGSGGNGSPGSGGNGSAPGSGAAPGSGGDAGGQTAPRELKPIAELTIRDNKVVGGFKKLSYTRNDLVRLRVRSDVNDIVTVTGYNISRSVDDDQVAEFDFDATLNGVFEVSLRKRGLALAYVIVKGDIEDRR